MEIDVTKMFGAVVREVASEERDGQPTRAVIATRTYETEIEDLWDALTNIERIPRWFSPVSGDLRLGGRYQIEGNAGGTITACEAPRSFASTWEFMGGVSWLEVELTPQGESSTTLRLKHTAPIDDHWQRFGPGAVGVGWDLTLIGMARHIATGAAVNPQEFEAWTISDEGKQFVRLASDDWGRAAIADGDDEEAARAAAENTRLFYTGEAEFPMPGAQP
jgi:uncharacterized protein YndB with AHSA1/START domain